MRSIGNEGGRTSTRLKRRRARRQRECEATLEAFTGHFNQKTIEEGAIVDMNKAVERETGGLNDPEREPKRKDKGKGRADLDRGESEKPTST